MYTRNIEQRLLLSFTQAHRIRRFIDNQVFKQVFEIQDHHVVVKNSLKLKDFTEYNVLSKFYTDEEIYLKLLEIKKDYNSKFKKDFGITLDEYEKEKL